MTIQHDPAVIEHVARAIQGLGGHGRTWEQVSSFSRALFRRDALAALDSLATAPGWNEEIKGPSIGYDGSSGFSDAVRIPAHRRLIGPWQEVRGDE